MVSGPRRVRRVVAAICMGVPIAEAARAQTFLARGRASSRTRRWRIAIASV